ncbi:MAG: hypothetical protein AAF583_04135 [Pseudomonadota bacterium]
MGPYCGNEQIVAGEFVLETFNKGAQQLGRAVGFIARRTLIVPVGDLDPDEDANHDDYEVYSHSKPVLGFDMFGNAAQ